jgi:predicted lipoprotein with Yx(FWY)xxD motif
VNTPTSPASLALGQNSSIGSYLTDAAGKTLYLYTNDTPGTSTCYSTCATTWMPLLTNGTPVAGSGVDANMLGTITRTDGSTQVTYNSWPLYYYSGDSAAGQTNGEGSGSVWYVVSPAGNKE